jgi:hypothetical protein
VVITGVFEYNNSRRRLQEEPVDEQPTEEEPTEE